MSLRINWTILLVYLYLVYVSVSNCYESNDVGTVAKPRAMTDAAFALRGYLKTYTTQPSHGKTSAARELTKTKCGNGGTNDGQNCSPTTDDSVGNVKTPGSNKRFDTLLVLIKRLEFLCLTYDDPNHVEVKAYDPKLQICCNGLYNRTTKNEQCCNTEIIDKEERLCCGSVHINKSTDIDCCASTLYLRNFTLCCNGALVQKTKYSVCCGDRVISELTEICCGGRTFPKALDDDGAKCCGDSLCNGTLPPILGQPNKPGPVSGDTVPSIFGQSNKPGSSIVGVAPDNVFFRNIALSVFAFFGSIAVCWASLIFWKWHGLKHRIKQLDCTVYKRHTKENDVDRKSLLEKACNRRTVLGQPFEHSCIVDMKTPIFQLPNSEVSVRLPDNNLMQCPIEMHGSSFGDILAIHNKINIPTSEDIASPVVEYLLTSVSCLDDYAVVTVPFIGTKDLIRVWKFHTDDGMSTKVEPIEISRRTKENKDQPLYYEIQGDKARIYTRSFSGFFITKERHNRQKCLNLHAYLFGSHKRFQPGRNEVRLRLYIADEIMKFKDFKQDMFQNEEVGGRHLKIDQPITLTEKVHEEDILEACMTVNTGEGEQWVHRIHPGTGQPIYPVVKRIKFEDIVTKCPYCPNCHFKFKRIPYVVEWYLGNSGPINDAFSCLVDINCISGQNQQQNVITVDELLLRQEDMLPVEVSNEEERLVALKQFLISLDEDDQAKFIKKIKENYGCKGMRIPDIFTDLLRTMKAVGIYEATVATLKLGNLDKQLQLLENQKILEDKYFPKPVQRTGEDASSGTDRIRGSVHANTQEHANGQATHGQSGGQAFNGQSGGQASHGKSGGQAFNGQSGCQASDEQSVGLAVNGQSGGQASHGKSGGQAFNRQSGCQASDEQSVGLAFNGQSGGQASHGKSGGQAFNGQSGGQASDEQSVGLAFNGQSSGQALFGQSVDQALHGQSGGQVSNGQSGGQVLHGQSGGKVLHGRSGGQAFNGQSGGQALHGQSGGQAFHGQSGGKVLHGQSGGKDLQGQLGCKGLHGQSEGKDLHGQSDGKDLHGQSDGKDLHGQSRGKDLQRQSDGKDLHGQSRGKELHGQSDGKDVHGHTGGKESQGHSDGKDSHGQSGGKDLHGQSGGQDSLRQSVGQVRYAGEDNNIIFNVTHEYATGSSACATGYSKDEIKKSDDFHHDNALCRNELGSDIPVCSYLRAEGDQDANILGSYARQPVPTESVELAEWTCTVPVQEHASLDDTFLKQTWESDTE